jgi:hypothetical protein
MKAMASTADRPVEPLDTQPLAVNLETARAFGLTVPRAVVARADEMIR